MPPNYGCLLLRPKEVGIDDPEEPTILGKLASALGAEVVETPYSKVCCGSYQTLRDKYVVSNLAYDILSHMQDQGAEAILLSCPLCCFQIWTSDKRKSKKPILTFKKYRYFISLNLMSVAMELGEQAYRFDLNYVDPKPLLRNKKLLREE